MTPPPSPLRLRQRYAAAADLIAATGWSRNAPARNAEDQPCRPTDVGAAAFSAVGALHAVAETEWELRWLLHIAVERIYRNDPSMGPRWRDAGTDGHVLQTWNDLEGNDAASVAEVLRACGASIPERSDA